MVRKTIRGRTLRAFAALVLLATTLAGAPAQLGAQEAPTESFVVITVENNQAADGFFFTEVWGGLHNGDFDLFELGAAPSPGLEALAEDGNPAVLIDEFAQPGRLQTTVGNTPIFPGSTHTESIQVINAAAYPYFSFASMLLPSNDAFFGNDAPDAYPIFDAEGNALGPVTIEITASELWDAGTEVNDVMGLPFVPAAAGTTATDTTDGVSALTDGLAPYVGAGTAPGTTIAAALTADDIVATITVEVVEQVVSEQVHVRVESLQEEGGFFFTSVWAGLHDGDFDLFADSDDTVDGNQATPGLESLAEDGMTALISEEFLAPGARLDTTVGPTPFAPGGVFESSIDVINPENYQYLTFASMLLPSNDAFFTVDPVQVFDAAGNPAGLQEIYVFAEDVFDAGTEANTGTGLPFIVDGMNDVEGAATDTNDAIAPLEGGLAEYVGLPTLPGAEILTTLDAEEPIAKIYVYAGPARTCGGEDVTVNLALGEMPTDGDDVILGTDGDDVINGLGGNDVICGEGGNDTINAGNGADTVFGGAGDDVINAGQGRDTVYGQGGDDFVSGGRGKDTLVGGGGDDDLRGNNGTDTISGGAGNDAINGGQKADVLNGDNGDDTIVGGTRPDTIDGGAGADILDGGGSDFDTCVEDAGDAGVVSCEILS